MKIGETWREKVKKKREKREKRENKGVVSIIVFNPRGNNKCS